MEGKIVEEAPMTAPTEAHVASVASQRIALPACPKCRDRQLAPTASEFVSKGQVRHFWSCEACGHEFSTSVKLAFMRSVPAL
jgi:ribosomal protein L37AE/L43A